MPGLDTPSLVERMQICAELVGEHADQTHDTDEIKAFARMSLQSLVPDLLAHRHTAMNVEAMAARFAFEAAQDYDRELDDMIDLQAQFGGIALMEVLRSFDASNTFGEQGFMLSVRFEPRIVHASESDLALADKIAIPFVDVVTLSAA